VLEETLAIETLAIETRAPADHRLLPLGASRHGFSSLAVRTPKLPLVWVVPKMFPAGSRKTPASAMVSDAAGNFYGQTGGGGANQGGAAFELIPNGDRTIWKRQDTTAAMAKKTTPVNRWRLALPAPRSKETATPRPRSAITRR
jgi:hypothetical protein